VRPLAEIRSDIAFEMMSTGSSSLLEEFEEAVRADEVLDKWDKWDKWATTVSPAEYIGLREALKEVVRSLVPKYHPDHPEDHGFSFETGRILADLLRRE
jgi:hypothetical protein